MIRWFKKTKAQVAKAITMALAPFIVLVDMEGKQVKHYAWTMQDALDWMACYDACDAVDVYYLYAMFFDESLVAGRVAS